MLEFSTARSGATTVSIHGRYLHSRVDPEREAGRFVEESSKELGAPPTCVVLVGTGLGYVTAALRKRWPEASLIGISLCNELGSRAFGRPDVVLDARSERFEEELFRQIETVNADQPLVLRWNPAYRAFPELGAAAEHLVGEIFRRITSSRITTGFYGKRWARNALYNVLTTDRSVAVTNRPSCVAVVAPGPSLERILDEASQGLRRVSVWALSSAVPILLSRSIQPDIVVTTDPGFYASHHIRELPRSVAIAMPLTADCRGGDWGKLIIDQRSFVEASLFDRLSTFVPRLPAHGTVAGTAYHLAKYLGVADVVFLGFDLANYDVHEHSRPHAFDRLLESAGSRFEPELTVKYTRAIADSSRISNTRWRTSRALDTYAGWFETHAADAFRVSNSPSRVGMHTIATDDFARLASTSQGSLALASAEWPAATTRRAAVADVVSEWATLADSLSAHAEPQRTVAAHVGILTAIALPELLRFRRAAPHESAEAVTGLASTVREFVESVRKFVR